MAAPIDLREDFDAFGVTRFGKKAAGCESRSRALLALAEIYGAGSRGQAARIGGVGTEDDPRLGTAVQR